MASEVFSSGRTHHLSCFEQVKKSKWTDVALITGSAILLLFGILTSAGVFNSIGFAQAGWMYGAAALLLIAEVIKVAINRCSNRSGTSLEEPSTITTIHAQSEKERRLAGWGNLEEHNEQQKNAIRAFSVIKYVMTCSMGSSSSLGWPGWRVRVIETYQFTPDNYDEVIKHFEARIDACTALKQYTSVRTDGHFARLRDDGTPGTGALVVELGVLEPIPHD